jgi:hypothetical protein
MLKILRVQCVKVHISELVAMPKLAHSECSSCLLTCTQENDNKNRIPNKTPTPGEGRCKELEIKGDISYPTGDLTTMLEP